MDFEQQRKAFDAIGAGYDAAFSNKQRQKALSVWLGEALEKGSHVLDAACGTGLPTAATLSRLGHHVTGVDLSDEMLRLARANAPSAQFLSMNMLDTCIAEHGPFDAITAFFALVMLTRAQMQDALTLWRRIIKPNGYLVIAMVDGDFDDLELPFLGQRVFASTVPHSRFVEMLKQTGWKVEVFETEGYPRANLDTPEETHHYYICSADPGHGASLNRGI
ncbi:MAG: class I SAM-dependent methyltransferase [Proteobacteria bacterium]|nr:class I SAM-dependent methyltransferase [Pseudomonadota bacterium]